MSRLRVVASLSISLALAAMSCSGTEGDQAAPSCPEGTTRRTSTGEVEGEGSETREEAIRAALAEIGIEASDDAVATGVGAAAPGEDAGTEVVEVETEDGSTATFTLAPLDPGWAVHDPSWCEPDAA
jgi:hypothetical protein